MLSRVSAVRSDAAAEFPAAAATPTAPLSGAVARDDAASSEIAARRPLRYLTWPVAAVVIAWLTAFFVLSPQPIAEIAARWPLFFLGMAGALIGNATAVGGGLIFVPATMFLYQMDPVVSLRLAIACQVFGMTSGAVGWWRRGCVPVRALWYGAPLLLVGCVLGGLVFRPDAAMVKGLFGPVSVAIGVSTLLFGARARQVARVPRFALLGVAVCALVGSVITAWVAIGAGEIVAAYLMMRWGVRADVTIALGVAYLALCSIVLAIFYQAAGELPWREVAFMGLGCILGARLGPYLAQHVPERVIRHAFAAIAIGDGCLFIWLFNAS